MSYIAQDIITMAQRLLVDIEDDAYEDDMLDYFNEWQRRFANETHCVQKSVDITVASNAVDYSAIVSAISNALDIVHVFQVRNNVGFHYLPKAHIADLKDLPADTVTVATRYWLFGKQVIFDLSPDATISFVAQMQVSYIPVDLASAAQQTLIPDEWAQAGVHYLAYCARIADRDGGLANGHYTEYEAIRLQAALLYKSQMES
jgi:hypothetical protein